MDQKREAAVSPAELLRRAREEQDIMLRDRRTLHREPEVGAHLPRTCAYVRQRLTEMGYEPK